MRLLLVMPTGLQIGYDEYFSASPLGIETLAAHARQVADVSLIDMRGRGQDVEVHAALLLSERPHMIGVSINSAPHFNYSMALAAAIRELEPDVGIFVGGQQATFLTDDILATGSVDAVIRGEGEHAICEILTQGSFAGVAGVSWRDGDRIVNEPDRPLIANLDDVLLPARDLLPDRSRYRMGAYRVEGLETSRGCPNQCSFCSVRNFHRGKWRPKSVGRVMEEIDDLLERYPEQKVIYFADDSFATDIRRVEEICRAIVERRTDTHFWCQARGDALAAHPEVVEWMGKAKFAAVLMGVETPIPHLMAEARKGSSVDQILDAINLLHEHDVGVWGTFVLGLPGETLEETKQSAAFIPTTGVDVVQITVATPIPGSQLYEDAKATDKLLTHNWDDYDYSSPTMAGQLPKAEMDAILQGAYFKSYVRWRFLRSLLSTRTNLNRLKRTALRVFSTWIVFVVKQRVGEFFTRFMPGAGKRRAAKIAAPMKTAPTPCAPAAPQASSTNETPEPAAPSAD